MKGFEDIIITEVDDAEGAIKTSTNKSVHVAFVMDHSGSMNGQRKLARDNFNEQIATLKQNSDSINTWVSLIEFDNRIDVPYEDVSVDNVEPVKNYWTGGTTSLNDAIFKSIKIIENRMKNDTTEDKSALIIIMTDGHENSSVEFAGNEGRDTIKAEIKKLEKTNKWTFTFMGADIDVQDIAVAGFGMSAGNTFAFNKNSRGFKMSGDSVKSGVTAYYSARMDGQTCVKNFHDNDTGTADVDAPVTSSTAKEDKEK